MDSQRQGDKRRRRLTLFTAALSAAAVVAVALEYTEATTAPVAVTGEYTGEVSQDGPVYRLPPVRVVADRESALACIEHEEQRERARAAQATSAGKPNV